MKLKFFTAGLIVLTGAQSNGLCPEGYKETTNDAGFTCADIDECTLGTDTCSDNASCTNTVPRNGGPKFTCECFEGKRTNFGHRIMYLKFKS